jgi:hypothetical protein
MHGCCDDCFFLYCRIDRAYRYHPLMTGLLVHERCAVRDALVNAIIANPYGAEAVSLLKVERFIEEWMDADDDERAVLQSERRRVYFRTHCKRTARLPGAGVFH